VSPRYLATRTAGHDIRTAPGNTLSILPWLLDAIANGASRTEVVRRIEAARLSPDEIGWLMGWLKKWVVYRQAGACRLFFRQLIC
jgi:hypothetical protein